MSSSNRLVIRELCLWGVLGLSIAGAVTYLGSRLPELQRLAHKQAFEAKSSASDAGLVQREASSDPRDSSARQTKADGDVAWDAVRLQLDRSGQYSGQFELNGSPVEALVDTGASAVALTYEDARRAGVSISDADYIYRTQTANGVGRAAQVMLTRVSIGHIEVHNVRAFVMEPGALRQTLIGMTFLNRLQRFEVRSGELILKE